LDTWIARHNDKNPDAKINIFLLEGAIRFLEHLIRICDLQPSKCVLSPIAEFAKTPAENIMRL
jgi:hypothetical protein